MVLLHVADTLHIPLLPGWDPDGYRMAWPAHSQPLLTAELRAARSFSTWKTPITPQKGLVQAMHELAQPEFFLPLLPLQQRTGPCG